LGLRLFGCALSACAILLRERQRSGATHHFALLVGKHFLEAIRGHYLIALLLWHRSQVTGSSHHHPAAVRWKLLHLPHLIFLLRGQVLPGFLTVQHSQLLLRRQARKMLQALPKLLLLFRRQALECGIVFQRAFLLRRRDVFVAPQPVAAMAWYGFMPLLLLPLLVRRRNEMFLLLQSKPMRQQGGRKGDG